MAACWDGCSLRWMLVGMAASDSSYFADFEQVKILVVILLTLIRSKILVVILLTLSRSKKLATKLPREKLDAYASFFGHGLMSRHSTLASQTCEGLHQL